MYGGGSYMYYDPAMGSSNDYFSNNYYYDTGSFVDPAGYKDYFTVDYGDIYSGNQWHI